MVSGLNEVKLLVEALYEVACDAQDADIARIALSALTNTQVGMAYLAQNPIMR